MSPDERLAASLLDLHVEDTLDTEVWQTLAHEAIHYSHGLLIERDQARATVIRQRVEIRTLRDERERYTRAQIGERR
jgi:hypothetical protein